MLNLTAMRPLTGDLSLCCGNLARPLVGFKYPTAFHKYFTLQAPLEMHSGVRTAGTPLHIMIAGAPAAGKGTQCQRIVEKVTQTLGPYYLPISVRMTSSAGQGRRLPPGHFFVCMASSAVFRVGMAVKPFPAQAAGVRVSQLNRVSKRDSRCRG